MKKQDYITEQRKIIQQANQRIANYFLPFVEPQLKKIKRFLFEGQNTHARLSGVWTCRQSPVGWCIYDEWSDPQYLYCLFCNQPSERK